MEIKRKEIKFLTNYENTIKLKKSLVKLLYHDRNTIRNDKYYNVLSIYFDNQNFQFYLDKIEGIDNRIKPRLRFYFNEKNQPQKCFLELKKKYNQMIFKEKVQISLSDAELILAGKINFIYQKYSKNKTFIEFFLLHKKFFLKPKIRVKYKREATYCKYYNNLRITFDKFLKASIISLNNISTKNYLPIIDSDLQIIELKFDYAIPDVILKEFKNIELQQSTFSKYAESINKCYNFKKYMHSVT